jgi:hypothetical protein
VSDFVSSEALSSSGDWGARFVGDMIGKAVEKQAECYCHRCIEEKQIKARNAGQFLLNTMMMILCPKCGNKRCPHASDHNLVCTGSNKPGQEGSVYE